MLEILSAVEMKKVDDCSINQYKIPALALMETAARYVYKAIRKRHKVTEKIVAVAGTGNNGADGIAAIRMLKAEGYNNVAVIVASKDTKHTAEWDTQFEIAKKLDIPFYYYSDLENENVFSEYAVIVDGIFGIGLTRPVTGIFYNIINQINNSKKVVYAVDIPSGIDGNTGNVMGIAVKASYTITFGNYKIGQLLYPGADYAGEISVHRIGFPTAAYKNSDIIYSYEKSDLKEVFPKRVDHSNKGTYGKLLVVAGNEQIYGALYMAVKAAQSIGTGLIRVITTQENKELLCSQLPEVMISTYNNDNYISIVKEGLNWCNTILIGPGMGVGDRTEALLRSCLETGKNIVIDADGINTLAKIKDWGKLLHSNVLITPHLLEMSRLISVPVAEIGQNLVEVCRKTSKKNNINIILKDSRSCSCNTLGKTYINITGNNGMAKGGSGDVLSGIVAGLIATGTKIEAAGAIAAFIHGLCGDIARDKKGVYAMIPTDIIKCLENI